MDMFIQYADEQPPESAATYHRGISGPYTNLEKKRGEGKQLCSLLCHVGHTYCITMHDVVNVCPVSALLSNMCWTFFTTSIQISV